MQTTVTNNTLAQMFSPVKSTDPSVIKDTLNSMIHHKEPLPGKRIIVSYDGIRNSKAYGVSSTYRILSPQLLLKKHNYVLGCLKEVLGMPTNQRSITFELLRLWAYYGKVYPKESQITLDSWTSKATFWRTVKLLEELGLVRRIRRYVIRPHAQISNLYRLDKLVLLIARYLAEHGTPFYEKWLRPVLTMPGYLFWTRCFAASLCADSDGRRTLTLLAPS